MTRGAVVVGSWWWTGRDGKKEGFDGGDCVVVLIDGMCVRERLGDNGGGSFGVQWWVLLVRYFYYLWMV